ncbi:MAG: TetR/AcrR family transcriptional regulator [Nitrospinae bacterium]|nr:TetR/AcrR family transcriptional regulator [Nitrospinota bacterium]
MEISKKIFFSRGFSKVTVDELAEELGVSKKTIYANFESKDELLSAVLEWHMEEIVGKTDEILSSSDDFMVRLYNLCALISEAISQKSPEFMSDLQKNREDLWQRLEEHRRVGVLSTSSRLMEEGMKLGLIRRDVDKEIANLVLLFSISGIINPKTLGKKSFDGALAFDGIMSIFFEGILTDKARGSVKKYRSTEPVC